MAKKATTARWELPTDREPLESEEQKDLVRWFRQKWPGHLIYAVPNGGKRGAREAAKMRTEGVTAGIPDLEIPALRLYIELKRQKTGTTKPEQRVMIAHLNMIDGCEAIVCRGSADAQAAILRRNELLGLPLDVKPQIPAIYHAPPKARKSRGR